MGKLFENFEAYDVQETRRVAREEGIRVGIEQGIEQGIRNLIRTNKKHGISKDETVSDLMELYNLSDEEAHKTIELFW